MDLEVTSAGADASGTYTTLRVTGILDLSTSQELIDAGLRVLWHDSGLALDLSQVRFMDASGVAALSALARSAERESRTFAIAAASFPVRRLLQILDLTEEWIPAPRTRTETG